MQRPADDTIIALPLIFGHVCYLSRLHGNVNYHNITTMLLIYFVCWNYGILLHVSTYSSILFIFIF